MTTPRLTRLTAVLLCVALVLLQFAFVRGIGSDVAYMDTLRYLGYYDAMQQGTATLLGTWNQDEHRGLIFQLVLAANAGLFGLGIQGANLLSVLVIALTSLGLCFALVRAAERAMPPGWRRNLAALTGILVSLIAGFSLAGFELMTLDLGLSLYIKNLMFIAFWFLFDALLRERVPAGYAWPVAVLGIINILVVGMGWSYAFVLASLALAALHALERGGRTLARPPGLPVLLALLLAQLAYVWLGGGITRADPGTAPGGPLVQVSATLVSFMLALSSAFIGTEVEAWLALPRPIELAMGALLLVTAMASYAYRVFGRHGQGRSAVPYALMAYGLLCAASVAVSRGRYDVEIAKASRYFMDLGLVAVALVWARLDSIPDAAGRGRLPGRALTMAVATIAALFLAGHAYTYKMEWDKAPYRKLFFDQMRAVTLKESPTAADVAILQSPVDTALNGIRVQRDYRLGPFRDATAPGCTLESLQPLAGWYGEEKGGRWVDGTSQALLSGCAETVTIAVYSPAQAAQKQVVVEIDGGPGATHVVAPGASGRIEIPVAATRPSHRLSISVTPVTLPSADSPDVRSLGVFVTEVRSH